MDAEIYEKAFIRVETTEELKEIWSPDRPVQEMIEELEDLLDMNLEDLDSWFEEPVNPSDEKDILTGKLTFSQFRRRLGNFLLFKIFDISPIEDMLFPEFIIIMRNKYAQPKQEARRKSQLFVNEVKEPLESRNKSQGKPEPFEEKAFVHIPETSTWLNPHLQEHKDKVFDLFTSYSHSQGLSPTDSVKIHREILKLSQLQINPRAINIYAKMTAGNNNLQFLEFIEILEKWAESCSWAVKSFEELLENTIEEFTNIQTNFEDLNYETLNESIQNIQNVLQSHRQRLKDNKEKKEREFELKALKEIFLYYARLIISFGIRPTFDEIQTNTTSLSLAKYMKFSHEFGLVSKTTEKGTLDKTILTMIFKVSASNTRMMSYYQFLQSLDRIAEFLYSDEVFLHKRRRLYKFMNLRSYLKKLYDRKKPARSSNRYSFQISALRKKELEEWRNRKHRYQESARSQSIANYKPTKNLTQEFHLGYSNRYRRKRMSHDFLERQTNQTTMSIRSELPITFQKLGKLFIRDLDKHIGADDDTESDAIFEQLYGKEQLRHSNIIKLQDRNMNKGYSVLRRNKLVEHLLEH